MATQDQIRELLEQLLIKSLISFDEIEAEVEGEDVLRLNIKTDEPALVIGKHADTLFSLQQVIRLLARKQLEVTQHIILDVDNYRKSQETSATHAAEQALRQVRETGRAHELVPMPSYKRRAVHTFFLQPEYTDVKVYSVGEGDQRRIRVEPKSADE